VLFGIRLACSDALRRRLRRRTPGAAEARSAVRPSGGERRSLLMLQSNTR
jgi:hypothetical protein